MKEPTMEEILKLVQFERDEDGSLKVLHVNGCVKGNIWGSVGGSVNGSVWCSVWGDVVYNVYGDVQGNIKGNVKGNIEGSVGGTIAGLPWQPIETPKEKAIRLIREGRGEEAIKVLESDSKAKVKQHFGGE